VRELGVLARAFEERELELREKKLAERVAGEVLDALSVRDTVSATDVASRRREESREWRDERRPRSESWDHIEREESGESSMSDAEARELLKSLRRRGKRTGQRTG
jgi:hypothetical protein